MLLTVMLEKILESPLYCMETQPIHPKGSQSWMFIGKTDAEAETRKLWPHDVKNWFIGKDSDAGKDWRQEEKRCQRMRWLDGTTDSKVMCLGVGDGQGGLACCGPWGCKKSDMTKQLNWTELLMRFSRQEYWSALPFPSPVDYILSELSTMTCPSWVAYAAWVIVSLS